MWDDGPCGRLKGRHEEEYRIAVNWFRARRGTTEVHPGRKAADCLCGLSRFVVDGLSQQQCRQKRISNQAINLPRVTSILPLQGADPWTGRQPRNEYRTSIANPLHRRRFVLLIFFAYLMLELLLFVLGVHGKAQDSNRPTCFLHLTFRPQSWL